MKSHAYIDRFGVECIEYIDDGIEFHYLMTSFSPTPHRIDGPAEAYANGEKRWAIMGRYHTTNESFQKAAKLSDDDMIVLNLKYGPIST
jgi:hypothetical protein